MADETWPSTLPQYVDRGSFVFGLSASSISTGMSTGYAKRRKRFTGQYATYAVSMIVTDEQADIFEQFFNNNLGYGVVFMDFPDPLFLTDTIEVRIKAGSGDVPYTFVPYGDTELWILSFELERLISSHSSVSTDSWPSALPTCPLLNGYTSEVQSGIVRDSNYSSGVIETRRRFTATYRGHGVSFLLTGEQLQTFVNFYASLGYGSLSFEAPYPNDPSTTMEARFDTSGGIAYTVGYYNDTNKFIVSFIWEELPSLQGYE
jgi:hypothetical protein